MRTVRAAVPERFEVHREIAPLAAEWELLADHARAHPFLRPGWLGPWWRAFGAGRLEILALRRAGRLVAVMPLRRRRGALVSLSNYHTPEYGVLGEDASAAERLARAVLSRRARRVSCAFCDPASAAVLAGASARTHRRVLRSVVERSPYVTTSGDWAAYLRGRDARLRRDLRRRRRRLEERGEVRLEVADGRERLGALLEEGFAVEPSGWKAERHSAIASSEETRRFYAEVAAWAAARGILRLSFLRLDGRALAFQYGLEDGGAYYFVKGGYDPAERQAAPGKLLLAGLLERAFNEGLASFEFLGVDEAWKLEWTSDVRERLVVHAIRPTTGALEWAAIAGGPGGVGRRLAIR